MRRAVVSFCLLLTGCAAMPGGTTECTMIGMPSGIGVDVARGVAAHAAEVEVCRDGRCETFRVDLRPATEAVDEGCDDTGPDGVCSAGVRETGETTGFAPVPDLPDRPLEVTLTVSDRAGESLATGTVRATPQWGPPNGPGCGAGGPQLQLRVSGDGTVSVR
ncbi:hypothetical protein SZMC14600_01086 [Saccharomonospora azurea SZMC 14600]|uniref:hypothetical protein n=1 Tax=Saccharomonospora azurea TaxID=40988 RepID=UPI00024007B4|nr:hypothetical protein [Saccharomonospora azurea]EHK89252.1 hypothetical protein SZMC14600_01086 [Saccharomonospora azurea SZMC 14600]